MKPSAERHVQQHHHQQQKQQQLAGGGWKSDGKCDGWRGGGIVKTRQRDGQQRKNAAKRKYCGTISFFCYLTFLLLYFLLIFIVFCLLFRRTPTRTHTNALKASSPAGQKF